MRISYCHILLMAPPIECDLGYWFRTRTLNPNFNPNPKTNPNPNRKSNNNLCSAKRHPNKVQDSVINTSYFVGQGWGVKAYNCEASTTDNLSGTPSAKQGFGWGN